MSLITLKNECWTLELLPQWGASILNLRAASGRPVLRTVKPEQVKSSSNTAAFALMPYSNRIRRARFEFGGRTVQLRPAPGSANVQHGDVRNRPWTVEEVGETYLHAVFDSRTFSDINWPWPFTARLEYRLHGPHLDIALTLDNAGTEVMPAGIGLHPYFERLQDGQEPTLEFSVGGWYATDDEHLPLGGPQPVPAALDFSAARPVGSEQIDAVFASWDGTARLSWPSRGLTLTADNVYSHLVLFTAPDGSLALEPVSHATDAFNLAARGVAGTDMKTLAPGQSLAGAVRLSLDGKW
ncbi:aldose 1-epimerase [Deinococcus irradiatisoli]|uniref:Aldose 1-epimerase n=1 Tax=Deinococcus irradiatisoli TaxID=2202254 RepID=A0A2Z3JL84_9DEIO|nr:aldose 1-epimerase [Deinococcus irradiatisoli]AWN23659.1 aldose 1-epimerase [Deinococcus irradiatisoli]